MTTSLPPDLARRSREDFDFLVLCQAKNNMGMYSMLSDKSLKDDIVAFRESQKVIVCASDQENSG